LEALRDRDVLLSLIEDVAGSTIAAANADEKGKVLKGIIRDHLAGADGREKREGWVPRWMAFPPSAYTGRGGVATVGRAADAAKALAEDQSPDPEIPSSDLPTGGEDGDEPSGQAGNDPAPAGHGHDGGDSPDPVTLPLAA
jgi:ParB family chromosome partitioning protein